MELNKGWMDEFHLDRLFKYLIDHKLRHTISILIDDPTKLNLDVETHDSFPMELLDDLAGFNHVEYVTTNKRTGWISLQCISWSEHSRQEDIKSGRQSPYTSMS